MTSVVWGSLRVHGSSAFGYAVTISEDLTRYSSFQLTNVFPLLIGRVGMNCPKCGAEVDTLVVNVQDGSEGCWPCVAGPDQMMLRKVLLETETGTEVVLVHARNN